MNRGINVAEEAYYQYDKTKKCVFISHKSEDVVAAECVGELLKNRGINIYLDYYDEDLQKATMENDTKLIVKNIEKALSKSTDILVLITKSTEKSWWVPYEVGYAKNSKKSIASLLLKTVDNFLFL